MRRLSWEVKQCEFTQLGEWQSFGSETIICHFSADGKSLELARLSGWVSSVPATFRLQLCRQLDSEARMHCPTLSGSSGCPVKQGNGKTPWAVNKGNEKHAGRNVEAER